MSYRFVSQYLTKWDGGWSIYSRQECTTTFSNFPLIDIIIAHHQEVSRTYENIATSRCSHNECMAPISEAFSTFMFPIFCFKRQTLSPSHFLREQLSCFNDSATLILSGWFDLKFVAILISSLCATSFLQQTFALLRFSLFVHHSEFIIFIL